MTAVAVLLVIGAWMVRTRVVAGAFALSHQPGIVVAYFKATEVVLWRQGRAEERYVATSLDPAVADQPHDVWESIDAELRDRMGATAERPMSELSWRNLAQGNRTEHDSFAVSRALGRIGWDRLRQRPLATLACCVVRCGTLVAFPLNLAVDRPAGVSGNRVVWFGLGCIYSVLALAVLWRLMRGRWALLEVWFPLAGLAALLLAATPQVDPRFRVPMIPLLLVLAFLPRRGVGRVSTAGQGDQYAMSND
jgi:hypothetical protein